MCAHCPELTILLDKASEKFLQNNDEHGPRQAKMRLLAHSRSLIRAFVVVTGLFDTGKSYNEVKHQVIWTQ